MSALSWLARQQARYLAVREDHRRKMRSALLDRRRREQQEHVKEVVAKHKMAINEAFMARLSGNPLRLPVPQWTVDPYTPPTFVAPDDHVLAMDAAWEGSWGCGGSAPIAFTGLGFPGFPYLTELTQITEYRDMSERTAKEMTRKWIKFKTVSGKDRSDKIGEIEAEWRRLKVRKICQRFVELEEQMGRCQIFMDLGDTEGQELETPLLMNQYKILKGSLRKIKIVEPITTYPAAYNSSWPLKADYYAPSAWFVYGQKVHDTRMLTGVARPLPDLLKPVYNFSGMSLSQLAQPYVDYWLNTRDSVGALLKNFSCSVLKTDLSTVLSGTDDPSVLSRAMMFNQVRNNQGLMLLDKETEEFEKHETSLGGLADLQAQAQEHMAAVAKMPLVIMLGITPKGLNATNEGDLKIYYDYVEDQQEVLLRENLETLLKVTMLSLWGEIIDDITFEFEPLMTMSGKEMAMIQKSKNEGAQILVALGAVTPEEVRGQVASDPDSGWNNLDVDHPEGPMTPAQPKAAGGKVSAEQGASEGAAEAAEMNGPDTALVHDANQWTDGRLGTSKKTHAQRAELLTRRAEQASGDACGDATHRKAAEAHLKAASFHGLDSIQGDKHWRQAMDHIKECGGWQA